MPEPTPLTPVPDALAFRFRHGPLAHDLAEFAAAIAAAPAEDVHYHREHYAAWVRDVLRDAPLARRVESYASAGAAPDVYRETLLDLVARRVEILRASDASVARG